MLHQEVFELRVDVYMFIFTNPELARLCCFATSLNISTFSRCS